MIRAWHFVGKKLRDGRPVIAARDADRDAALHAARKQFNGLVYECFGRVK